MYRHSPILRLQHGAANRQTGAVLIVALVLLLVLTILGVAGMQNTTMEERMAGNYRDRFGAFQAAEAALRVGEESIADYGTFSVIDFGATPGTYALDSYTAGIDPFDETNYQKSLDGGFSIDEVSSSPMYFLEQLPKVPLPQSSLVLGFQSKPEDIQYYRVTGRGTGVSDRTEVVLQSTYHR